jgi:hypothetical protein
LSIKPHNALPGKLILRPDGRKVISLQESRQLFAEQAKRNDSMNDVVRVSVGIPRPKVSEPLIEQADDLPCTNVAKFRMESPIAEETKRPVFLLLAIALQKLANLNKNVRYLLLFLRRTIHQIE